MSAAAPASSHAIKRCDGLGPIRSAFPNVGWVHKIIEEAVAKAYETAQAASDEIQPWLPSLMGLSGEEP
jgi:hypothetical protein